MMLTEYGLHLDDTMKTVNVSQQLLEKVVANTIEHATKLMISESEFDAVSNRMYCPGAFCGDLRLGRSEGYLVGLIWASPGIPWSQFPKLLADCWNIVLQMLNTAN